MTTTRPTTITTPWNALKTMQFSFLSYIILIICGGSIFVANGFHVSSPTTTSPFVKIRWFRTTTSPGRISRYGASKNGENISSNYDNNDSVDDNIPNEFTTNDDNSNGSAAGTDSSFSSSQRPNKLDIYNENELADLLKLHTDLYPSMIERNKKEEEENNILDDSSDSDNDFPSLHDLVLQTVEDIEDEQDDEAETSTTSNNNSMSWLPKSIESKLGNIRAIASDVDGTILDSEYQQVHPRTKQAIFQAVELSNINRQSNDNNNKNQPQSLQWFFPATGKSRAGALSSLGPDIAELLQDGPGVYCQGLYCVGPDGNVVFEKKLSKEAIQQTEQLVEFTGTSIIAYDGDTLYTTDLNPTVRELHEKWGEPLSTEIDSIEGYGPGVHKVLVCDQDVDKLRNVVRPQLEQVAAATGSVVTQAVPTMLEILPEGCSKALGVSKLCEVLGVDPSTELLSCGDAENDVEMLQMAAIGVAVGNANDLAKAAAGVVVPLTSSEGGAGLTIELALKEG